MPELLISAVYPEMLDPQRELGRRSEHTRSAAAKSPAASRTISSLLLLAQGRRRISTRRTQRWNERRE
jgi:hypothetical protein